MRLFLIRHAESTANAARILDTRIPGPGLTPHGRQQAADLRDRFRNIPLHAIYASTMRRTTETAQYLGVAKGLPISITEGLHEVEAGNYEGTTDSISENRYRSVIADWARDRFTTTMPGADDGVHFLDRFDRAMGRILNAHSETATLCVITHSVAMRVWVASRATNASPAFTATAQLDNAGIVELCCDGKADITLVRWQGRDSSSANFNG